MPGWASPQLGGLPYLQHSHGQNSPQLSGLPGRADQATRLGWDTPPLMSMRSGKKDRLYGEIGYPTEAAYLTVLGNPPTCEQPLRYYSSNLHP